MNQTIKVGIGDVILRPYDPARDADRVAQIVGQIWSGGGDALMEKYYGVIGNQPWGYWQAQSVLGYIKAENCRAFVLEENGQVIGFTSYLIDRGRSLGTVGYNGIAPEHQGRKLGNAMMDYVMKCFHDEGMAYAAVIVADNAQHAPARRVYEKYGFTRNLLGLDYLVQKL